jgi:hypothetical protein
VEARLSAKRIKTESMKNPLLYRITGCALIAAAVLSTSTSFAAEGTSPSKPAADAAKPAAEKFYGAVTKVDTEKKTFTIGDQTFTVVASSALTTKDDKKATLADAVIGERARGSYIKKSDGTLEIVKVRFGKKEAAGKSGGSGKSGGKNGGKKKDDSGAKKADSGATPPSQ